MARLIGIVLFVAAIYFAVTAATEDADGASASDPQVAEESAGGFEDEPAQAERSEGTEAAPSRGSVTSRVRDRVQGAIDESTERLGAE